ncbi:dipeptide/oligopeptide/nickel ABC transporter permease/ATP-binding protein [Microbacterium sp. NPDC077184]|uniref:dipeptide/oligopeptide/nickel ABC transporter permease/ATP-binding protein n=1 Tax=Microbacterium sp. NPDC077184 TaxID=3154764 RepID=UPI00343046B7
MTVPTTAILQPRRAPKLNSRILRSPAAILSIVFLVGLVVASLTGPLWLRYGPLEQDLAAVLQGPSAEHLLGTDELGRDLLSRIVTAAAPTLLIALIAPVVAVLVTVPLTLWAARYARAESFVGRASEIIWALPGMIIILAAIAAVGTNMPIIMAIFGLLLFGALYRVFIGQAMSLHKQLYVEAAAVDGVKPMRASLRHVLPNMSTTVIVQFVLLFGAAISIQAGLAFIGLGPQPPEPTWGGMINTASRFIFQQPWMMIPPGVVLALTIIAANTLADVASGGKAMPPPLIALRRRKKATSAPGPEGADDRSTSAAGGDGEGLVVQDLVIAVDGGPDLVTGVSFRVRPGTVMGLVGESGCGKSVTSHAMLGLLTPGLTVRSGTISWNGVDLSTAKEATMKKVRGHEIAFISQEPTRALDPMFTVGTQLTEAIKRLRRVSRSEAKEIALQLLTDVGIVDPPRVLKSYPHQISGGMAQRVAIGLALAGTPKLLIADEPTTALDVTVQAEILALLRALVAERDMAIVIVTHDLGVVADICDEVSVMYAGELVETGGVRDVLVRPEHPYTMALLAADPHAAVQLAHADTLASIPGQVPAPAEWPSGCRFAERCRFATDDCLGTVPLDPRAEGEGLVRCVRRDEVKGRQEEWRMPVSIGGESA